jgi:hypothetical protein
MKTELINALVVPDDVSGITGIASPETGAIQPELTDAEIFAAEFAGVGAWMPDADIDCGGTDIAPRASEGYSYSPTMATFIAAQAARGHRMPWMKCSTIVSYANDKRLRLLGITR